MYQGDKEALAWLDSPTYWTVGVKSRMVWVGKGQTYEAYEMSTSANGWAPSDLVTNEMFAFKLDNYCDVPNNPRCTCFMAPEQLWSKGPFTAEEESEWLLYEDPCYTDEEFNKFYEWWRECGGENNLIREETTEDVVSV